MNLKKKKYLLLDLDGVCYGSHNGYPLEKVFGIVSKRMTKFIKGRQGPEYPKEVIQSVDSTKPKGQRVKTTTIPRSGTRAAKLKAKTWKTGGTVKRKSGGKMNTDGNSFVASLYKGGKVGG